MLKTDHAILRFGKVHETRSSCSRIFRRVNIELFGGRYDSKIKGTLQCLDRVIIKGTLPSCCHPKAIENYLWKREILFFDFTDFAKNITDEVRIHMDSVAKDAGIKIDYLKSSRIRKEDFVEKKLEANPDKTGVVCILSVLENCLSYKATFNKETGRCSMKYDPGRCLTYYIYINDPEFGLCFFAFPTWAPFPVRMYFNGHNWLKTKMDQAGITYRQEDNCFTAISDFESAQAIADSFDVKPLHKKLDRWAKRFCPAVIREFFDYHWSLHEVEFATDVVFDSPESLGPLYEEVVHTALCEIKVKNVATFLGRSIKNSKFDAGSRLSERLEGTSIRHKLDKAAIKMYDKKGCVLRVETVLNDVSCLKTFREVHHRDGTVSWKNADVKKSIYSLKDLRGLMGRANKRYLTFIGGLVERSVELAALEKLTSPVLDRNTKRTVRGLNFFNSDDKLLFTSLLSGEYRLNGITNRQLRSTHLKDWDSGKVSRALKRLRLHRLIRKVSGSHKYYLTKLGEQVLAPILKLQTRIIIPALNS